MSAQNFNRGSLCCDFEVAIEVLHTIDTLKEEQELDIKIQHYEYNDLEDTTPLDNIEDIKELEVTVNSIQEALDITEFFKRNTTCEVNYIGSLGGVVHPKLPNTVYIDKSYGEFDINYSCTNDKVPKLSYKEFKEKYLGQNSFSTAIFKGIKIKEGMCIYSCAGPYLNSTYDYWNNCLYEMVVINGELCAKEISNNEIAPLNVIKDFIIFIKENIYSKDCLWGNSNTKKYEELIDRIFKKSNI